MYIQYNYLSHFYLRNKEWLYDLRLVYETVCWPHWYSMNTIPVAFIGWAYINIIKVIRECQPRFRELQDKSHFRIVVYKKILHVLYKITVVTADCKAQQSWNFRIGVYMNINIELGCFQVRVSNWHDWRWDFKTSGILGLFKKGITSVNCGISVRFN